MNLIDQIKEYFKDFESNAIYERVRLIVLRQDGQVLFHNLPSKEQNFGPSLGALLGGSWQAVKTLTDFLPKVDKEKNFRLSFDTSSDGVYVLPVSLEDSTLYMGALYSKALNPGQLKNSLRKEAQNLEEFLLKKTYTGQVKKPLISSSQKLFDHISDEEMDKLFSI